jgi:superfamily II DNA or RNA helicase
MSIAASLEDLTDKEKEIIIQDLTISSKADFAGYSKGVNIYPYEVVEDLVYVPFYYGTQFFKQYPNDDFAFPKAELNFTGTLRDYQTDVVKEAVAQLNKTRCVFLSMATGKGKTLTSIYLASRLKVKVCVLLYRINLFEQWEESIKKVIPKSTVQILDSKCPIDPEADFYLINPINVMKRSREDFDGVGLLIADEAHALCSGKMSKSFLYFTPKWCIGLSATPERSDELHKIIELHFGKTQINVPLYVEHDYYRFDTQLVPDVKRNMKGDTDWNSVLEFQATHPERNLCIVRMCIFFKERNILILCKRVEHAKTLHRMLTDENESVDYTTGTKKKFDKDARILVSTYSKSGVGFDHPKLDMMIVASDVEEMFEQYFGRCVRREDVVPIFIDIVDSYKSLERHFGTRKSYAKSVGGKIKDFRLSFPKFFTETEIEFT